VVTINLIVLFSHQVNFNNLESINVYTQTYMKQKSFIL
jgi:hypothetical protein